VDKTGEFTLSAGNWDADSAEVFAGLSQFSEIAVRRLATTTDEALSAFIYEPAESKVRAAYVRNDLFDANVLFR